MCFGDLFSWFQSDLPKCQLPFMSLSATWSFATQYRRCSRPISNSKKRNEHYWFSTLQNKLEKTKGIIYQLILCRNFEDRLLFGRFEMGKIVFFFAALLKTAVTINLCYYFALRTIQWECTRKDCTSLPFFPTVSEWRCFSKEQQKTNPRGSVCLPSSRPSSTPLRFRAEWFTQALSLPLKTLKMGLYWVENFLIATYSGLLRYLNFGILIKSH